MFDGLGLNRLSKEGRWEELDEHIDDEFIDAFATTGEPGEIAGKLNLSMKTIGTYRERIKEKLGLANANELIRFTVRWIERHPELKITFLGDDGSD